MNSKYYILLIVTVLTVFLDLMVKVYVHNSFMLSESVPVLPNFFNLTYVRNPGAAFGFLASSDPAFRNIFFTIMPPIACLIIFLLLKSVPTDDKVQVLSLSFIMGGALGNYLNRMYYGYVIDFLDFHFYQKYNWPAFNLADVFIVCGVGALLLRMTKEEQRKKDSL